MSIHDAAKRGDIAELQRLLFRVHKIDARDRGGSGNTPLLYAVSNNQADAALLLIQAGADVNAKTGRGEEISDCGSALHVATACGHLRLAKVLLDAGANLNSLHDFVSAYGRAPVRMQHFKNKACAEWHGRKRSQLPVVRNRVCLRCP